MAHVCKGSILFSKILYICQDSVIFVKIVLSWYFPPRNYDILRNVPKDNVIFAD